MGRAPGEPPARCSTAEALARFDALPPAGMEFMLGDWKGEGLLTGHPLDGALEAFHWHGKRFHRPEDVDPLVFTTAAGRRVRVNPALLAPAMPWVMRWPWLKSPVPARLARLLLPLLATRRSRARLRMVQHRGVATATMIYDDVPIQDVFRIVDADTAMGMMDLKGMQQPFFFILRREGR